MRCLAAQAARNYLEPKDVEVILYHGPCCDGTASALAGWLKFQDKINYIQMDYAKDFDDSKIKDKNVLVVDFSFKKTVLEQLRTKANKILILDHHKSAQEELREVDGCYFDMKHSGAGLSWQYFSEDNEQMPKIFEYVQDRDLWMFRFKETKAVHAYLMKITKDQSDIDFASLALLINNVEIDKAIEDGSRILIEQDTWIDTNALKASLRQIKALGQDYAVYALELESGYLLSELAERLYLQNNVDFVILWYRSRQGKYKVSLRSASDSGVNVAKIAESFGGGGHIRAAGFIMDENPATKLMR